MLGMGELILIRHGETEWSRSGQHTGRTDVPLTDGRPWLPPGWLARALAARPIVATFTSPASRAADTAKLAGLPEPGARSQPAGVGLRRLRGPDQRADNARETGWYLWRDGVIPGDADHPG